MTRKIGQLPSIIILEQRNQLIIIFCIALIAKKVLLPKVFEEFKGLGTNPDVVSLVSNWDALKILAKYIDYVGCFLTWNKAHHTGPNSRRFMREPNEHPDYSFLHNFCCHKKRSQKQASLTSQPRKKIIALDKSSSSTTTTKQTKIIGKYSKTHHFNRIETFVINLSIRGECSTSWHNLGKDFACQWYILVSTRCYQMMLSYRIIKLLLLVSAKILVT